MVQLKITGSLFCGYLTDADIPASQDLRGYALLSTSPHQAAGGAVDTLTACFFFL